MAATAVSSSSSALTVAAGCAPNSQRARTTFAQRRAVRNGLLVNQQLVIQEEKWVSVEE
jgi:hypothetical protein